MSGKGKLVKDLVLWVALVIVIGILLMVWAGGFDASCFVVGVIFAGVPFGWKWANNIITAVGPIGLIIKFVISFFIGLVAAPVTIIKDIIGAVKEN